MMFVLFLYIYASLRQKNARVSSGILSGYRFQFFWLPTKLISENCLSKGLILQRY